MSSSSYSSPYGQVFRSSENLTSPGGYDRPQKCPARIKTTNAISPDAATQHQVSDPPRPPRSAFMCFTDAKKKEIMDKRGIVEGNDEILNIVAEEWKSLSEKDRAHWDEECRNDKVRYVSAKTAYKGPSMVPKRRAKKHPMAPKRPMSAFLKFSQKRRQRVKRENPDMSNTDVSRLLGEMWRNASPKEKAPYREQEERERALYKENAKRFKEEQARADAESRTSHQTVHGYRHHYHHPGEEYHRQNHHQRSYSFQPPPIASPFETLRMDSFDEPAPATSSIAGARPGPFRSPYDHPHPPFRQTFAPATEPVSLHDPDYPEDPLQVAPAKISLQVMDEEDNIHANYGSSRSSYFHENPKLAYFTRYG